MNLYMYEAPQSKSAEMHEAMNELFANEDMFVRSQMKAH